MAFDPTISGRWVINYNSKRIYRVSGKYPGADLPFKEGRIRVNPPGWNSIDSVVDLYSFLQDSFDEAESMDDKVPMSAQTPNAFTMINGWFIDDESVKYLNDGAIQSDGWDTAGTEVFIFDYTPANEFEGPVDDPLLNTATSGGDLDKVIFNAAHSGTILYVDSGRTPQKVFVRPLDSDQTFAAVGNYSVVDGQGTGTLDLKHTAGETLYTNLFTLGTIQEPWGQIHLYQSGMDVGDSGDVYTWGGGTKWWPSGHIDLLIKVTEAGTSIDGGSVTPFLRQYTDLYDSFPIDLSAGGRQAAPLATGDDLNNTTLFSTVSGYGRDATPLTEDVTINFVNIRAPHGGATGTFLPFERVTWPGGGKGRIIENVGDSVAYIANEQGTWPDTEVYTGTHTGATLTSTKDSRAATMPQNFDQQVTNPPYNVIIECSGRTVAEVYEFCKYVTTSGQKQLVGFRLFGPAAGPWEDPIREVGEEYLAANANYVPVKASPFGTFAGGTFFGARGVWLQNMDAADIQAFSLIDASGTTQDPPNQVSITVNNTAASDQVFVARSGTVDGVEKDAFVVDPQADGVGIVTVQSAIPSDTPSAGFIRVYVAVSGTEDRYEYTSWTGSVFTLGGGTPTTNQAYDDTTATAYVPFIDEAATGATTTKTVIFNASDVLVARVRRYQGAGDSLIPFETYSTLGTGGFSATTVRQSDTIVQ